MEIENLKLSISGLIRRSLLYYWRSNAAAALGVAVAAAALVGSLLVGDSVKGSLRELALERLGRADYALTGYRFFREELANDLASSSGQAMLSVPAILLNGAAKHPSSGEIVPHVAILGAPDDFWRLGGRGPSSELAGRNVILNQNLADDLHCRRGDAILVTIGRPSAVSTETVFGRRDREHTARALRVIVNEVIPAHGIGGFSLRNDQPRPRNIYISLSWLQRQLKRDGEANTILVASKDGGTAADIGVLEKALASTIRLEDYGLRLATNAERGYVSLESRRLVLPPFVVEAAEKAAKETGLELGLTSVYLANSLALVKDGAATKSVPYSVVAGMNPQEKPPLGPLPMANQKEAPTLGRDDILLNEWTANDLGAKEGDDIELTYYVAGRRGELRTERRTFSLRGVVAMKGAGLDPELVPEYEGITDAKTMTEWDPPFPIELGRIRPKDEEYWEKYRATPKAYVAIDAVRGFWQSATSSEQGWVTSVRVASPDVPPRDMSRTVDVFSARLLRLLLPDDFGLTFRPVKSEALAAAKGSTDFGVLFLSMSMFLVASAAVLVGLLLRLTVERRASQYGILLATGSQPKSAARILMGEGMLLALIGGAIGVPLGVGYAWLIIYGLRTRWSGAAGEFVFSLHVQPASLVVGLASALVVAAATILWSARILRRTQTLTLLAGWRALATAPRGGIRRRAIGIGVGALSLAAVLFIVSAGLGLVSPTGAFFGIGAALLIGAVALFCAQLQSGGGQMAESLSLPRLAWRGASRQWLRSMLTVGLLACASFIIVTVAANRKDLTRLDTTQRSSGSGGFNLMARSDLPIYYDLSSEEGRKRLGLSPEASRRLAGSRIIPLRMTEGDDVSCRNIQRSATPRVLGAPHELVERGGFTFAKVLTSESSDAARANPWKLLEEESLSGAPSSGPGSPPIPAFADAATAQWILHLGLGDEIEIPAKRGGRARLRIVGLLSNSIFASEFLIAEEQFIRCFGADSGYRLFLIESSDEAAVASALRENLGELGLDVLRTADVLAGFARVQNTYLATFQTLGSLGLFLGTFGIVTVLLRAVAERRSELAMMLALGFRRARLVTMIVLENGLLLIVGVLIGTVSALAAVAPHLISVVADVKWLPLAAALLVCVVVGLASCSAAACSAVRGELLAALRSE